MSAVDASLKTMLPPTDLSAASPLKRIAQAMARVVFGRLLPRIPYPVLRGPLRGSWFILGATAGEAGGISVHLGLQEIEQTACLTRLLKPGNVFFDVGANVGHYSLLASRLVKDSGRVVAVEPLPRNLAFLQRHIDLNGTANITVLPLACAERAATEFFCRGDNNALGHLSDNRHDVRTIVVSTVPLDCVAEKLNLNPDVVKIDVEGAELRVLTGATNLLRHVRPSLLLSIHSDRLREECLGFLADHKYRARPINAASMDHATEFLALPAS